MTRKVEEAWPVRVLSKTGGGGGALGGGLVMLLGNLALEPPSYISHISNQKQCQS